jgi:uncharacterized membrane protein
MLAGFASGQLFELVEKRRENLFLKIGVMAILLFVVIRLVNLYGDPAPWATQKNQIFTFLSFMNITKYPPSLMFDLITLGIMFLFLALAGHLNQKTKNFCSVYGKVPLFYFIVHFYLIHILTLGMLSLQGYNWPQFEFMAGTFGRPKIGISGLELWAIYLIWIGVVLALYQPCVWYGKYKTGNAKWWLRYI